MKQNSPTCLRFTKEQDNYFKKLKILIKQSTGEKVSKTWIIKKMMAYGQEQFHNNFKITFDTLKRTEVSKEKT